MNLAVKKGVVPVALAVKKGAARVAALVAPAVKKGAVPVVSPVENPVENLVAGQGVALDIVEVALPKVVIAMIPVWIMEIAASMFVTHAPSWVPVGEGAWLKGVVAKAGRPHPVPVTKLVAASPLPVAVIAMKSA